MHMNKGDHHAFTIDKKGNVKANLNIVAYMKVAPRDFLSQLTSADGQPMDSASMKQGKSFGKESLQKLVNSKSWPIARTIYCSLTLKGRINIEKIQDTEVSRLKAGFGSFSISKLDFYKGMVEKTEQEPEDDSDFDDEDDDGGSSNDAKTMEGGLIMALVNMQLQQRFNHFLPQFDHDFTNEIAKSDIFDCYGMHLEVPELTYFQGGFMIKGDYKQIPVNELACGNITANSTELLSLSSLLPDKLSGKLQGLDQAFGFLEAVNPDIATYLMKPSELLETATTQGIDALVTQLGDKFDKLFGSVSVNVDGADVKGVKGLGQAFT